MSLGKSLAATLLIFAAVWSLAYLGSASLRAAPGAESDSAKRTTLEIIGLSGPVDMASDQDAVDDLWQRFYDMTELHMALEQDQAARVYGYYRFDDPDTARATVTIGYDTHSRGVGGYPTLVRVSTENHELIHESTESWDTSAAWMQISDERSPHSVLEEYQMDAGGEVVATRVYVDYR